MKQDKKKKIYQTKPFYKRKFFIGSIDGVIIPVESAKKDVFCTLKSICDALDMDYQLARRGNRIDGNKMIIECGMIKGDYAGGKFASKNTGEQNSLQNKWRDDIEYDENV